MRELLSFLFLLAVLCGCHNEAEKNDYIPQYSITQPFVTKPVYIFGIYAGENPKRIFEQYGPMIDYLNARMTKGKFQIEASRNLPSFNQKLFSGHFDFALANPYATVTSSQKGYRIFGKMGNDDIFKGLIIVRKDSGIKSINDLRGKVVSYPDQTALAAVIMPQWYFYKHGLNIDKDIKNSYVGSQESSIMNVYLKKSDAACTWPPPWNNFIKERPQMAGELMVKWQTPALLNNGLVVREDIPKSVAKEAGEILFAMHTEIEGQEILKEMHISRYEKADEKTYDPVRKFLQKFEKEVHPIKGEK